MTNSRAYAFETIIAVRKGRGAIHLSQQVGTWASAPLFVQTLCGRPITNAGGWVEVQECATCQRCEKECAEIDSARAFLIDEAHTAALVEATERAHSDDDTHTQWHECEIELDDSAYVDTVAPVGSMARPIPPVPADPKPMRSAR
jgi:hypothetical protein